LKEVNTKIRILYCPVVVQPGVYSPRYCLDSYEEKNDGISIAKKMAISLKSYYRGNLDLPAAAAAAAAATDGTEKNATTEEEKKEESTHVANTVPARRGSVNKGAARRKSLAGMTPVEKAAEDKKTCSIMGPLIQCLDVTGEIQHGDMLLFVLY
jgi:hypothetical protein